MSENKSISTPVKFLLGGVSGVAATCVVQPMDLVKNRLQISGKKSSTFEVLKNVIKQEGITSLYDGLSAGIFRQITYTTARLGVFNTLQDKFSTNGKAPNLPTLMAIGAVAGACGAVVGTPAEVTLVRMTSDKGLPVEARRNYRNVLDALIKICQKEGVLSLWTGCSPTVGRAIVVNITQLSSYSKMKSYLLENEIMQNGVPLHFLASVFSGFTTSVCSTPIDTIKTRIQNSRGEYKNALDCTMKTLKNEGAGAFMKGFTPFFLRVAPHTILTFMVMEQLTALYKSYL